MKKRFLSLIIALAMMVGVFTPLLSSAEPQAGTPAGPTVDAETKAKVTIHKIQVKSTEGFPLELKEGANEIVGKDGKTKYSGGEIAENDIAGFFGEGSKELANVTFTYWVFDDEQAYKDMVADPSAFDTVDEVKAKLNADGSDVITTANGVAIPEITVPANGHKYVWAVEKSKTITADDGKQQTITEAIAVPFGLALPLFNADGNVNTDIHVYPKNTLVNQPKMDKNFDTEDNKDAKGVKEADLVGDNKNLALDLDNNQKDKPTATRNIGDKVPYKVETKIPQGAKYQKLVWTDVMTKGLTFDKDSLTIEGGNIGTNYEIVQDDRGFTLKLTDAGLKAVEEAAKGAEVTITLKYSATINKDAEVDTTDENDIALDYGNKPRHEDTPKEGNPVNKQISVEKSWARPGENETITEADANAKVVYTLQEKDGETWKNVKSVLVGADEQFKYTFTGLDNNKTYRVIERVSGYEPQYTSFENGVAKITNKGDKDNPKPINPSEPKVVTGGKKFVKTDEKEARLSGAQFYVKNAAGEYLVPTTDNAAEVEEAKTARDQALKDYNDRKQGADESKEAFEAARKTLKETFEQKQKEYFEKFEANATAYTFSTDKTNAYVLTSGEGGRLSIKGLAYGEYTLEEKEAPSGYAKQTEDVKFTVKEGSYAGAAGDTEKHIDYKATDADTTQGKQIVNKKVTIPQTGGIGTIIFTAIGLAIMASAIIAIKKRQATEAR